MTRQEYIELVKQVWPNAETEPSLSNAENDMFDFVNIGSKEGYLYKSPFEKLQIRTYCLNPKRASISFYTDIKITE